MQIARLESNKLNTRNISVKVKRRRTGGSDRKEKEFVDVKMLPQVKEDFVFSNRVGAFDMQTAVVLAFLRDGLDDVDSNSRNKEEYNFTYLDLYNLSSLIRMSHMTRHVRSLGCSLHS